MNIFEYILIVVGIFIFIAAALLFFKKIVQHQIDLLIHNINNIEDINNLSREISISGKGEFGRIYLAINNMLKRLSMSADEILEANAQLKKEIKECRNLENDLRLKIDELNLLEDIWRKYEFIADASCDFMTLIDRNYIYEAANKAYCNAHRKTREQVVGCSAGDIWPLDRFENEIKGYLEQCFEGNKINYEEWFQFYSRERRCYNVSYYPYYNEKGMVTHAAVVSRDVTAHRKAEEERNQLEAQLRQTQKMEAIGQLAGGIAHDFNTLLGIILGYSDMLKDDIPEESIMREYLNGIRDAGNRAKIMINQMRDFSRPDRSELKPVQIASTIENALKMLRSSLPSTIDIQSRIKDRETLVMANLNQIHQLMLNLGVNAGDAIPEKGGMLEINLENFKVGRKLALLNSVKPGSYLKLSVMDTGCGMDSDILDKIFNPFFTTKDIGKGSGMGLSIVYGIVKGHNGFINVKSRPGIGSTFDVFIPVFEGILKPDMD